jgi:hypothetical protein
VVAVPPPHVSAFFIVLAVKARILIWLWGVNHELCAAGAVT